MKLPIDHDADALYFNLDESHAAENEEIVAPYFSRGRLLVAGITFTN